MRWRAGAPALAEAVAADWGLTMREAYVPGAVGHVVRVDTAEGEPAVLKVFFPDRETEQEPDALERWTATARSACCGATSSGGRCCSSCATPARPCRRSAGTRRST